MRGVRATWRGSVVAGRYRRERDDDIAAVEVMVMRAVLHGGETIDRSILRSIAVW